MGRFQARKGQKLTHTRTGKIIIASQVAKAISDISKGNDRSPTEIAEDNLKAASTEAARRASLLTYRVGKQSAKVAAKAGVMGTKLAAKGTAKASKSVANRVLTSAQKRKLKKQAKRIVGKTKNNAVLRATRVTLNVTRAVVMKLIAAVTTLVTTATPAILITVVVVSAVVFIASILPAWMTGMDAAMKEESGAVSIGAMVDDYPWKGRYNDGISPLGYAYGNCPDFVAWRINRDRGVTGAPWKYVNANLTPGGGNGGEWGERLPGWVTTTSPVSGDIISYKPGVMGSDSKYGHVAYIASNEGGEVTVENYGKGKYYLTRHTMKELGPLLSTRQVVIKHDPNNTGNTLNYDSFAGGGTHKYNTAGVLPETARGMNVLGNKFDVDIVGGWRPPDSYNEHSSGHAADFMVDKQKGDALAAYAVAHAKELNIKWIIWWQRIWINGTWQPMEDRGSPTQNHMDHVHINFDARG